MHVIQNYSAGSICMQSPKPGVNKSSGSSCKSPKPEVNNSSGHDAKISLARSRHKNKPMLVPGIWGQRFQTKVFGFFLYKFLIWKSYFRCVFPFSVDFRLFGNRGHKENTMTLKQLEIRVAKQVYFCVPPQLGLIFVSSPVSRHIHTCMHMYMYIYIYIYMLRYVYMYMHLY